MPSEVRSAELAAEAADVGMNLSDAQHAQLQLAAGDGQLFAGHSAIATHLESTNGFRYRSRPYLEECHEVVVTEKAARPYCCAGHQLTPTTFNPKLRWWTDKEWLERNDRYLLPDNHVGLHHHRILDRRFTLNSLATSVRHLPGSTAECGVFKGVSSAMICTALDGSYSQGAKHYGFDSFEGLPAPGSNDASWQRGQLATPLEATRSHLSDFKYCQLIVGWIPDTFTNVESEIFRLVHIDLDLEKPTTDALNSFIRVR